MFAFMLPFHGGSSVILLFSFLACSRNNNNNALCCICALLYYPYSCSPCPRVLNNNNNCYYLASAFMLPLHGISLVMLQFLSLLLELHQLLSSCYRLAFAFLLPFNGCIIILDLDNNNNNNCHHLAFAFVLPTHPLFTSPQQQQHQLLSSCLRLHGCSSITLLFSLLTRSRYNNNNNGYRLAFAFLLHFHGCPSSIILFSCPAFHNNYFSCSSAQAHRHCPRLRLSLFSSAHEVGRLYRVQCPRHPQ